MGLAIEVGILSDLSQHDPEAAASFRQSFEALNDVLLKHGRQAHREPDSCEVWSGEMVGYSGLHYLRRLAAHLDCGGALPTPGDHSSSTDPVLEAYFRDVAGERPGLLARVFGRAPTFQRGFDHLICHSDAEGFYVPQEFDDVIYASPDELVPGAMVGSVPRLRNELQRIAAALQIPEGLDSQSDEVLEASDAQGEGANLWQRYGVETYGCLVLLEACEHSMSSGAALVFT